MVWSGCWTRSLALVSIGLLKSYTAWCQVPDPVVTAQAPVPGVGHHYIGIGAETVNPADGSLSFDLPIQPRPGRQISFPFGIHYNSSERFSPSGTGPGVVWVKFPAPPFQLDGWNYQLPVYTAVVYKAPYGMNPQRQEVYCDYTKNYVFRGFDGVQRNLAGGAQWPDDGTHAGWECPAQGVSGASYDFLASSGIPTGYLHPPLTVVDPSGTTYVFPQYQLIVTSAPIPWGLMAQTITDRNGNQITFTGVSNSGTSGSYKDTLGQTVVSWSGIGSSSGDQLSVTGISTNIVVHWTHISEAFPESGHAVSYNPSPCTMKAYQTPAQTVSAVSEIDIPGNPAQKYQFLYDATYARPNKIIFPGGGYVRYVWGLNPSSASSHEAWPVSGSATAVCDLVYDTAAITDRYVSYDGATEVLHQHFAYDPTTWGTGVTAAIWSQKSTTVTNTDLVSGQVTITKYIYTSASDFGVAQVPVEQQILYQDAANHTVKTVNKTWLTPTRMIGEQTILDNGQGSAILRCYGDGFWQVSDIYEYGFQSEGAKTADPPCPQNGTALSAGLNTSAMGPLKRHTHTAYHDFFSTGTWIVNKPDSITVTDSSNNTVQQTSFTYDLSAVVSSGAISLVPVATSRGNITSITRWLNTGGVSPTTTYTYYDTGQVASSTDACGNAPCPDMAGSSHTTTYSYADNSSSCGGAAPASGSTNAYLTKIKDPLGHVRAYCYGYDDGQLRGSTDENSQTTLYKYNDPLRRLTETDYPDGGQTTVSYSDAPPSPSVTTSRKINTAGQYLTSTSIMDGLGRTTQTALTTDPDGATYTPTVYDALGRRYKVYNPTRCATPTTNCGESTWGYTTYIYDALGRVISVTAQDGSVTTTTYSGNCATTTDPAGKARKSCTDALGRLTQVFEDPSGLNYETDYTYDALDNLISVTQKGGITDSSKWRVRTFTYDSLSRLISATNPESGTVTYAYDANGNLISKTAPAPNQTGSATVTTTYTYDALNRLTSKSFSDGVTPSFYFTYDISSQYGFTFQNPIGRMALAERPCSSIFFSYDSMGRVINNEQATFLSCTGGAASPVPTYQYDLAGNMTTYVNGAGVWFTQAFDSAGRPTGLTSSLADAQHPGTLATVDPTHGYFPNGTLHTWKTGNGLTQTAALNSRLQPCRINVNYGNVSLNACTDPVPSTNVQDLAYGFNSGANNGNIASWSGSPWLNFNRSYTYDSLNRLSAMSSPSDPGGCTGLSWTYDAWGNRTDQTTTGGSCGQFHASVNAKNQLLDPVNNSYQYDAAGNVIFDGSHHYLYDAENRLIQVDPHSGYCSSQGNTSTAAACYVYDALGRRVAKIPASGVWTQYAYDLSGNVISEYGEGCGPTCWARGHVYFNGQRIAEYANSTTYFAHNDHLGSPRLFTDVTAAYATDCYDFLPFGERNLPTSPCSSPSPPAPPPVNTSHLFTGKERDSESGLDNFGARYNSSSMGRFMSPDWSAAPMGVPYADFGDPQSLNLYSYARNRPLTYVDRDGHCTEPLSFVICVAIGVAAVAYGVHELHEWQKEREKAENEAFQKSLGCTASNAQCTESEIRAYDKERLNTYGEGAIKAIENTVPDATPPTTITGVVVDQAKGKAIDAMVDSAKKKDDKQGPNQPKQPNQPGQPNPSQQPSVTPNNTPPPPPPTPPPPPPCALNKEKPC